MGSYVHIRFISTCTIFWSKQVVFFIRLVNSLNKISSLGCWYYYAAHLSHNQYLKFIRRWLILSSIMTSIPLFSIYTRSQKVDIIFNGVMKKLYDHNNYDISCIDVNIYYKIHCCAACFYKFVIWWKRLHFNVSQYFLTLKCFYLKTKKKKNR